MTTSETATARNVVVDFTLPPSPDAPWVARRVVGSLIDSAPRLRCLDASMLAGELVTLLTTQSEPIRVRLSVVGRAVRVEATTDGPVPEPDSIVTTILNRTSDRWGIDETAAWFEIDLVKAADLTDLSDDELFALMPDDRDARDELFDRYVGFATAIARRFSRGRTTDDFEQVAHWGLVEALERFDPQVGVKFTTFGGRWISGVIKRYLRDQSWTIRVPRGLKTQALAVTRTRSELEQSLGRQPTEDELAAELDISIDDLREAVMAGDAYALTSLDSPAGEDGSRSIGETIGFDDDGLAIAERWHEIETVLDTLDDREQQILHLRFFEDMTQAEIAEIIGVSQVHVSRLLSRSLEKVRARLDEPDPAPD